MEIVIIILAVAGLIYCIKLISKPPSPKAEFTLTDEFKEILHRLNSTDKSIFISGKAGTGKSSLLDYFMTKPLKKRELLKQITLFRG